MRPSTDEAELADADDASRRRHEAKPAHEPAVEDVGATVFATAEEKSALDDDLTLSIEDDEAWTPIPANDEPVCSTIRSGTGGGYLRPARLAHR